MNCRGFKRNGQPCTFHGRYNGYCGHHRCGHHRDFPLAINRTIVRRHSRHQRPIRLCVNQHCNRRSRNLPFITCQNHNHMEAIQRCYFQYENGHRCESLTNIAETYCPDHKLIVNETIRNMTWGPPSRVNTDLSYPSSSLHNHSEFIAFLDSQIPSRPSRPSRSSNNIIESKKQKIKKVVLLVETKMFNHDCPICFEHFNLNEEVYELKCKHHYHPKCLDQWIKQKVKNHHAHWIERK